MNESLNTMRRPSAVVRGRWTWGLRQDGRLVVEIAGAIEAALRSRGILPGRNSLC
jgi:hypothetical protein